MVHIFNFYNKLKQLGDISTQGIESKHEFDARLNVIFVLMQKHTLLTLVSITISIIMWLIFDILFFLFNNIKLSFLFILINILIKSICIIFMFRFYLSYFKTFCRPCFFFTHLCCCPKSHTDLFTYFAPKAVIAQYCSTGRKVSHIDDERKNNQLKQFK